MNCPRCGSSNVKVGVEWGASGFDVRIGLKQKKAIMTHIEQVYSDVCTDCGLVIATYVNAEGKKDNR